MQSAAYYAFYILSDSLTSLSSELGNKVSLTWKKELGGQESKLRKQLPK